MNHVRKISAIQNREDVEVSLFSGIHCIWHLAHILFFEARQGGPVLESLSSWINLNHVDSLQTSYEALMQKTLPQTSPLFWSLIKRCLLRGHFEAALGIFQTVQAYKDQLASNDFSLTLTPLGQFAKLLNAMPSYNTAESSQEFKTNWLNWIEEAKFTYADGNLSSLSFDHEEDRAHFVDLFGILAGEESLILKHAHSWQEGLVGLLRFCEPMAEAHQVGDLIQLLQIRFKTDLILDQIQFSILELDVPVTLQYCAHYDWWLVTHLSFLFEKANLIEQGLLSELHVTDCTLAEWYRLSYAEYLINVPSLWKAALDYMLESGKPGLDMLRHVIPRIPLDSDVKNKRLVAFCTKHQLHDSKTSILTVLGQRAFSAKRYEEAICHFLEAKKLGMISLIVEQVLGAYVKHGDKTYEQVADSLSVSSLSLSPSLAFLSRYRDFQKLYHSQQYQTAGKLLVLLLSSGAAPKSFWKMLLMDATPLLESELVVFNTEDTLELMRCAEDLIAQQMTLNYKHGTPLEENDQGLSVVKLALVRNLARSMVVAQ